MKSNKEFKRYLFMVLGCISYAFSIYAFLVPNKIVAGGISGAASLIHISSGLPVGVFIIILNIPILIFGLKLKGWVFILRCFITTLVLGLVTELFVNLPPITDDPILAAMYGGITQGIGIGLFIKYEVSSGGTELLGRITHNIFPYQSIAMHTAILDCFIVIAGAVFMNNIENVLYALILIFVSAKVSDIIILGVNKSKLCYIITDKPDEISKYLLNNSPRGITMINGVGMYTNMPKSVLMTCVKNNQITQLKLAVKEYDANAFVIINDTNEVFGKGFYSI